MAAAPSPATLIGASAASLSTTLVPPALRRVDGPAQVWLYTSRVCRLELVLYPGAAGQPQVSYARRMPRDVGTATCVASLERGRPS